MSNLNNCTVVLVETQGALNLGSVCRAMGNFGVKDLRLVNPQVEAKSSEAYRMAVKAAPILEGARIFPDLQSALADCTLAIGTTRRTGKYREEFLLPSDLPQTIRPVLTKGRVALLFGREDRGLHTEELDLCQKFLTIATDEAVPSMNLAQSVAVCLYELFHQSEARQDTPDRSAPLASVSELESLYTHMKKTLTQIEYLDPQNPDHILRTFRRIFSRAELDDREVRVLHGLFSKVDWVDGFRKERG